MGVAGSMASSISRGRDIIGGFDEESYDRDREGPILAARQPA
jgi:hypothetical protein